MGQCAVSGGISGGRGRVYEVADRTGPATHAHNDVGRGGTPGGQAAAHGRAFFSKRCFVAARCREATSLLCLGRADARRAAWRLIF